MSTATGMTIGYARVSTDDQDEALQRDALEKAGCERLFVDTASGTLGSRPALDAMLERLRPGDTVVVWRLDRLGRSLRHLISLVGDLEARGVQLRSLTEQLDTSTPAGRLVFHVFASMAEFERDLIRQRTMAGPQAARECGRPGGRPTVMTPEKLRAAKALLEAGESVSDAARAVGVSQATLYRARACHVETRPRETASARRASLESDRHSSLVEP